MFKCHQKVNNLKIKNRIIPIHIIFFIVLIHIPSLTHACTHILHPPLGHPVSRTFSYSLQLHLLHTFVLTHILLHHIASLMHSFIHLNPFSSSCTFSHTSPLLLLWCLSCISLHPHILSQTYLAPLSHSSKPPYHLLHIPAQCLRSMVLLSTKPNQWCVYHTHH